MDVSYKKPNESFLWRFVKKILLVDIIKGLFVTFNSSITPAISIRYPDEEKWIPYQRFRGALTLNYDKDGKELCVACELCAKICPTDCIKVIPIEDDSGKGITDRIAKEWIWNAVRCLFCGYCAEVCPTTAVRMGRDFELACYDLASAVKKKEDLLKPQTIPEDFEGGKVAKAKFVKTKDEIKVVALLNQILKNRNI